MERTIRPLKIAIALFFAVVVAALASDGSFSSGQKQEVRDVVREYLHNNPEVLVDAIRALQKKQLTADREKASVNLASLRGEIENDPSSPVGGNPDGDVTVVEFFDYRCGFCKRALATVIELVKTDKNIRYVFREYPILGPQSKTASRAALAVWQIDREKYMPFHIALMSAKGGLPETKIFTIAAKAGIDVNKLRVAMKDAAIEKILKRNHELANALGINGTPAFIIGEKLFPGIMDIAAMRKAVAATRKGNALSYR